MSHPLWLPLAFFFFRNSLWWQKQVSISKLPPLQKAECADLCVQDGFFRFQPKAIPPFSLSDRLLSGVRQFRGGHWWNHSNLSLSKSAELSFQEWVLLEPSTYSSVFLDHGHAELMTRMDLLSQTNLPFAFLPTHTFAPQSITYVSFYFLHPTLIKNFVACLIFSKHGFISSIGFLDNSSPGLLFLPLPKGFQFYCTNLIKTKLLRLVKGAVLSLCAPSSEPPHIKTKVLKVHIR